MTLIILDLDNCIADDEWRIPLIDWHQQDPTKRYHEYHLAAGADACFNRHIFENENAAIFTARPEQYRAATGAWLERNQVSCRHLFMRGDHDHRTSRAVKAGQLVQLSQLYDQDLRRLVTVACDDREDIVAMYNGAGLNGQRIWIHTTCAYTPPALRGGPKLAEIPPSNSKDMQ